MSHRKNPIPTPVRGAVPQKPEPPLAAVWEAVRPKFGACGAGSVTGRRRSAAVGTTWNGPSVVKRASLGVAYQVRQLLYSPSVGDL